MKYWTMTLCIIFSVITTMFTGMISISIAQDQRTITKDDYQKMMQKMEELSRQNEELTKRIKALEEKDLSGKDLQEVKENVKVLNGNVGEVKEDVKELSSIMEKVEKKSVLDRIQFSGELRTRSDWFDFKDNQANIKDSVTGLISNRFRLNLKSDVTDNLKFHGRLSMYKNWNGDQVPDWPVNNDQGAGRIRTDVNLKVERAYVDYFFNPFGKLPIAVTFGRLPTTDGLPTDLKDDAARKSSFPSLAFDRGTDGGGLSMFFENLFGLPDSALRFIYVRQNEAYNVNQIFRSDEDIDGKSNSFIAQLESGLPFEILKDSLFITNFIYEPQFIPQDLERMGFTELNMPDSLGKLWKLTFFIETKRFLRSWIDWFAGYSYMVTNPNQEAMVYYDPSDSLVKTKGLLSDDNKSVRNAHAYHFGIRCNFPIEMLNTPKLGVEYNHGSQYWIGFNNYSEDPLNRLSTRGDAWDFYYIQPLSKNFFLRGGYTMINYDYDGTVYGDPQRIDQKVSNTYILLDANF